MRLEWYLGRELLRGYGVVALGLGALLWLLGFLQQLDQGGDGGLSLPLALWGGFAQVPVQLLELLPVISVTATAGVITVLQANRETIILRLVGWTPRHLARVALLPLLVVVVVALACWQWVTPLLSQGNMGAFAKEQRDDGLWHEGHGLWLRGGDTLLNVGQLQRGGNPADINIFELDGAGRIVSHVHADYAVLEAADQWLLFDVREWQLQDSAIAPAVYPARPWPSFLSSSQLRLLQRAPEALSLTELARQIMGMRSSGQVLAAYELALWERMALPFACLGMTLVAVALVGRIRPGRGGGMGQDLVIALAIGLSYLLLSQLVTYGSLLAGMPTLLTAFASPSLLVLLGLILVIRAR